MSFAATLETAFSSESSEQEIELRIGTTLTKYVNSLGGKAKWSTEDCETAIACVKYLAHGTASEASRQHIHSWRLRFNNLKPKQSNLLYCLYIEAMTWDKPTLDALTSQLPH